MGEVDTIARHRRAPHADAALAERAARRSKLSRERFSPLARNRSAETSAIWSRWAKKRHGNDTVIVSLFELHCGHRFAR